MNILAIDTSDEVLSAALSSGNGVWYTEIDAGSKHSELLLDCVNKLCAFSGIEPKQLNLIACMKGPGSFTGLRIGFSTAKGLGMALEIPITAVPTLDCVAYPLGIWPGIVIPAIDARKQCFFTALYRGKERLTGYLDAEPHVIALKVKEFLAYQEEPVILTGSGAELLYPHLVSSFPGIKIDPQARNGRAKELLIIAKNSIFDYQSVFDSAPVYIRKSDAELNRA